MMRAVVADPPGDTGALQIVVRPEPTPGLGQVLIAVTATALNRADVLQRQGRYPPPPGASDVLGLEVSGEITAVGPQVTGVQAGARVMAILAGGGYADFAVVEASLAMPVPDRISTVDAAAIPEVFLTAFDNLFLRARLVAGETVLLHGGSSGVGTAAIQLAKRAGCRTLVTVGTPDKARACRRLGADEAIVYRDADFVEAVREHTGGRGVNVILDVVGGPYLDRNLDALTTGGRLVVIGLQGGASAPLALGKVLSKRLTVTGSTLRARSVQEKAALVARFAAEVLPGFDDGSLHPVIDRVFPLHQVAQAHRLMESSAHIGKIVLRLR